MSLIFTMPGKLGDALHQWPLVYHYCKVKKRKATLWLDEKTCKPLVPLFQAQPCIEAVELKAGIVSHHMGGQPWDFGLSTEEHQGNEIYHLGFRIFPTRQITLEVFNQVPLGIPMPDWSEPTLELGPVRSEKRLILHGNFAPVNGGVPSFWRWLYDLEEWIDHEFKGNVYFIGTESERKRAMELYPSWYGFEDHGDMLECARFVVGSTMVLGCGSAGIALAGALKVPSVRVHDPIGEYPRVIWSNLGPKQMNEPEHELRKLWPEFRDSVLTPEDGPGLEVMEADNGRSEGYVMTGNRKGSSVVYGGGSRRGRKVEA